MNLENDLVIASLPDSASINLMQHAYDKVE